MALSCCSPGSIELDCKDNKFLFHCQSGNFIHILENDEFICSGADDNITSSAEWRFAMGHGCASNANPYTSQPDTGITRNYTLILGQCSIAPDGMQSIYGYCFNGSFPGPLIEANYGDMISVTVINNLQDEGVSQCPIAPGWKQTYLFRATLYGSSWYHTHYSSQYMNGAVGPIVIHGPTEGRDYDVDLGPVMASDWYHNGYMWYVEQVLRPLSKGGPVPPLANSNLINGKMQYPCNVTRAYCKTAAYSEFNFTAGKTHRLRLMNTGSGAIQKFSIDNHTMTVIANDFMPLTPYNTQMIALGVGQRADVLVSGTGKPGDVYWLRANIAACSQNDGILTEALAVIRYSGGKAGVYPTAAPNIGPAASTDPRSCANDALATTNPAFAIPVTAPSTTITLNIKMESNGTHMLYHFGNNSFRAQYSYPDLGVRLWQNASGILQSPGTNILQMGSNTTVRAVIYNYDDAPHPIHLHGHNMMILQTGFGTWDGTVVRPSNPQRRDVQVMFPGTDAAPSYIVVQWDQDNPGYWPLHCHFSIHAAMGLFSVIEERPADIANYQSQGVGSYTLAQCLAWVAQVQPTDLLNNDIDSGV
ncbi:MAG: hypothetical protein M1828_007078 [Chrysothrix sp. TS-e1954]|nr:MAG: hypothetical protein M1828_007078 [Chrysothrix sp. TS-e1954]